MYGDNNAFSFLAILLSIISVMYGCVVRLRNRFYSWGLLKSKKLSCPVLSVGNITVGGTGKTPMVIFIARFLSQLGYNVAVLSRGYRGRLEKTGGVISDGKSALVGFDDAGDEPLMIASHLKDIPVLAGKRRFNMGLIAQQKFKSNLIILDDAFQHHQLRKDVNLVLLDSLRPFGNWHIFPRGILREPVRELARGDAFIMTRSDLTARSESSICSRRNVNKNKFPERPIFRTCHTPYHFKVDKGSVFHLEDIKSDALSEDFEILNNKKILAFSGIAGNHHFRITIEKTRCLLSGFMDFPDHYHYTKNDVDRILLKSKKLNVDYIVTTEKDYMRVYHRLPWPNDLIVVGVKISFEDEGLFQKFIKSKLDSIESRIQ